MLGFFFFQSHFLLLIFLVFLHTNTFKFQEIRVTHFCHHILCFPAPSPLLGLRPAALTLLSSS